MKTLPLVILVVAIGCGTPATEHDSVARKQNRIAETDDTIDRGISVIAIPRPNSGTYTTERATELLPAILARSAAVSRDDGTYTRWQNPTHGFRVFVHADGTIETRNVLNETGIGMERLKAALELSRAMQYGNPLSVLIVSETAGWTSETKTAIIDMLFQPSIQLYMIGK